MDIAFWDTPQKILFTLGTFKYSLISEASACARWKFLILNWFQDFDNAQWNIFYNL